MRLHVVPFSVLAALSLSATAFAAKTYTQTVNGITWTYTVSSGKASVGGSSSTAVPRSTTGSITIPSTLGGYPVASIGSSAFNGCSVLTSITIPNSVTNIGYSAFSGCTKLTSVTIPDSVTSIGNYAFDGCTGLTSVTIPDNVTSIRDGAFRDCTGLTSITLPDGVTSIGNEAFSGCTGLTSIRIPNSVTSIESYAFANCTGLTSVTIPDSVTNIGNFAFEGCTNIVETRINVPDLAAWCTNSINSELEGNHRLFLAGEEITTLVIPDVVTSIGNEAFRDCTGLTSVTIPNSVTNIGSVAFYGCSGLAFFSVGSGNVKYKSANGLLLSKDGKKLLFGINGNVTIPDGVTSIGDDAFCGCTGLTSVTIPNSVTSIGYAAFADCIELTSVTIPNSVTSIGNEAFYGCSGLGSISVDPDNPVYDSRNNCSAIIVSANSTLVSGCKNTVIPDSVTSIGYGAFSGCTGLTSVTIPNSVTSIGYGAFCGCTGLTSVTIPNSVTSIGDDAFCGCTGLTSVTIPNSVTSIGYEAFYGCIGLKEVVAPGRFQIRSIFSAAYQSITNVGIASGSTNIADSAFYNCSGLTTITIPDSVTSIGYAAFRDCSGLMSFSVGADNPNYASVNNLLLSKDGKTLIFGVNGNVTIPGSVTSIEEGAFYGCSGLASVTIPDSVTSIGWGAFCCCSGLVSVTIGNGVISIGDDAFRGCTGLTSVTIPNSVTSIGDYAFSGCTGLTSIAIPADVSELSDSTFSGCTGLRSLRLPRHFEGRTDALELPSGCTVEFYDTAALSVLSDWGKPSPTAGAHLREAPSVVTCSAGNPVEEGDGIRRVCTGWLGTGSVPASGTGASTTFLFTQDSALAWLWETQVRIECTVSGDATSDGAAIWATQDGEAVVVPFEPVCAGFSWTLTGDTQGVTVDADACTVTIPADRQRTLALNVRAQSIDDLAEEDIPATPDGSGWFTASGAGTDGGACLRSGAIGAGGVSPLETRVTGPGTLEFDWRISSSRGHYARFYLDGNQTNEITRSTDWATVSVALGDGPHVLRWTYEKGSGATAGEDAAFLDNVRWTPLTLAGALDATNVVWSTDGDAPWFPQLAVSADGESAARSGAVVGEAASRLAATVSGAGTLSWMWQADVAGIAGVDVYLDDVWLDDLYLDGASGWAAASLAIEGDGEHSVVFEFWNGGTSATFSDCAYLDGVSWTPTENDETLPSLAPDAAPSAVTNAIAGAGLADTAGILAAVGGSAAEYAAFRTWAQGVTGGEAAVAASAYAGVSYLLGATAPFENEPEIEFTGVEIGGGGSGDAKRDGGGADGAAPSLRVTVKVRDGADIATVDAAKVARMFEATSDLGDWTGTARLEPTATPDGTDADGAMRFIVTPGDGAADRVFLRIRVP